MKLAHAGIIFFLFSGLPYTFKTHREIFPLQLLWDLTIHPLYIEVSSWLKGSSCYLFCL